MANQTYKSLANGNTRAEYEGKVTLRETQNIENNLFHIDFWFWLYRDDGFTGPAHNFTNGNRVFVSINGKTLINVANYKTVILTGTSESNPFLLCSGSTDMPANPDGSKTFDFEFTYDQTQNNGQVLDYLTVAGSHVCTPIPRATAPTLSASSVEFGKAVTITTNRASTSFTHTLRYAFGNASGTIATGVSTSSTWTVPLALMNQIPSATSGNITIYCDTYSGSTLVGTKSVVLKATVPSSVIPTLSVAIAEAATIPSGITGYIQNKSKVKVTSAGVGSYGSTITSYAVTVDGTNYTGATVTSNTLTNSGTITIKVVVTDSRGRTATATKTITVIAYSAPKITSTSAFRCNSATDPTSNPSGEYICVQPRGSITALSNQNAKSCRIYYKKTGASSYSSVAVAMNDYVLDSEYVIFAAAGDSSYDIYATLADSFSSSEYDIPDVQTTAIPMDAYMDESGENVLGWAFGKQVEVTKAVDFGWEVFCRENITAYKRAYLKNGFNVASQYISSSGGYACVARFNIIGTYANCPIELTLSVRGQTIALSNLFIHFENANSLDPGLLVFRYRGTSQNAIMVKSGTSVWDLYVQTYPHDDVAILDLKTNWGHMASRVSISFPFTYRASAPSGTSPTLYNPASSAETAVYATNAGTATKATTADTANALASGVDITVNKMVAKDIEMSGGLETRGLELFGATPYFDFHFGNSTGDHTARIIENSSGVLTAYNSISSASDERLKKDFAEIPGVYLDLVDALNPEMFRFKSGDTYLNVGLVAQKVLDMEAFLGITESVLVRGTGKEIPNPKNPDEVMVDYYSIDYQAYNILRSMALERKMNRIISALGIVI